MIRIGLLGAGEVAERHTNGLVQAGGVRLVAVADPLPDRAEALARRFGFERVESAAERVIEAGDVDLVVVLTPHSLHAPQAIAALEAGKDVLCEKPMAPSVADCDAMIDAARRSGRSLLVTHTLRTEFFVLRTLKAIQRGGLGRPTLGSFRWFTDESSRLEEPGHWKGTVELSGGGVLIDGGAHVADLGNAVFGRPLRVQALAGRLVARREGLGEDTAAFSVEYASGALATFALSFVAGSAFHPRRFACGLDAVVFGTRGAIEGGYRIREQSCERYCREYRSGEPDRSHVDDGSGSPGAIDAALLEALRGEREPLVTAVDARNAVAVIEAAYRSLASSRTEEVDWLDEEP